MSAAAIFAENDAVLPTTPIVQLDKGCTQLRKGSKFRAILVAAAWLASFSVAEALDDGGARDFIRLNAPPLDSGRLFRPSMPALRYFTPAPAGNRPAPRVERQNDGGGSAQMGRVAGGAVCVRLCDGFYFPLQSGSMETRETLCRSLCPDAETAVYRGGVVETAVGDDGRSYASLKTAFLYRSERVNGCTCRADPGDRTKYLSPFRDPTLKAGDAVVTADGALILTSKGGPPFKSRDFVNFQAAGLPQLAKSRLATLLGISREGLLARASRPVLTAKSQVDPANEEDIPEITVTRRPVEAALPRQSDNRARVILPGPWVAQ